MPLEGLSVELRGTLVTVTKPNGEVWTDTFPSPCAAGVHAARMALVAGGWAVQRFKCPHHAADAAELHCFTATRRGASVSVHAAATEPTLLFLEEHGDTSEAFAVVRRYLGAPDAQPAPGPSAA
jgi:hypothetical protein